MYCHTTSCLRTARSEPQLEHGGFTPVLISAFTRLKTVTGPQPSPDNPLVSAILQTAAETTLRHSSDSLLNRGNPVDLRMCVLCLTTKGKSSRGPSFESGSPMREASISRRAHLKNARCTEFPSIVRFITFAIETSTLSILSISIDSLPQDLRSRNNVFSLLLSGTAKSRQVPSFLYQESQWPPPGRPFCIHRTSRISSVGFRRAGSRR